MKSNLAIILLVVVLVFCSDVDAGTNVYPPENAAVLYYKVMLQYSPEDDIGTLIDEIAVGEAAINEEAIKYIEDNKQIINDLAVAAGIEKCNWAIGEISYRHGIESLPSHLFRFKEISRLVLAEARLFESQGNYKQALERCVTVEKMAGHVSGQTSLPAMMGFGISVMNDKYVTHILEEMPPDTNILLKLRAQLKKYESRVQRIKKSFEGEKGGAAGIIDEYYQMSFTPEMIEQFRNGNEDEEEYPTWGEFTEKVVAKDKDFYKIFINYWTAVVDQQIAAFDLPYSKAYDKLSRQIPAKLKADVKVKPEAITPSIMLMHNDRIYSMAVRGQNLLDGLRAAVEVYLVKARTGKLPDVLPAGLPKDLFSGEDFVYERTANGFLLRCRGKDIGNDKFIEYEFKVAK